MRRERERGREEGEREREREWEGCSGTRESPCGEIKKEICSSFLNYFFYNRFRGSPDARSSVTLLWTFGCH